MLAQAVAHFRWGPWLTCMRVIFDAQGLTKSAASQALSSFNADMLELTQACPDDLAADCQCRGVVDQQNVSAKSQSQCLQLVEQLRAVTSLITGQSQA